MVTLLLLAKGKLLPLNHSKADLTNEPSDFYGLPYAFAALRTPVFGI